MSCLFSLLRSAPSPREELELWCNLVRGEGWGEEMDKSTLTQRARNLRKNSTAWLIEHGFKVQGLGIMIFFSKSYLSSKLS
jgi:hypothetical protein